MSNSLGLENLRIDETAEGKPAEQGNAKPQAGASKPSMETTPEKPVEQAAGEEPAEEQAEDKAEAEGKEKKEKKTPYVNPDRVKTGGAQRDKLSEDELAQRMVRIREQNEKIKQRRADVKADEDAFKKTQEAERARLARTKKVQEHVDRAREQNAQRKMDKLQTREWDSGKKVPPSGKQASNGGAKTEGEPQSPTSPGRGRGVGRGRGRGDGGRGRGRGSASQKEAASESPSTPAAETPATTATEAVPAS
ncbi:hypothetical protein GLOTRDRAFT_114923 [Gloeophyllum trabeum ATCC 11539]|uniref:Uncharacterized protein n=1 Tax=Gloeophyllum trabeum (strain ATCC 11539 / FP-39264 / Madison 617) TaxID=670483 RepID=S7QH95_GLOTA|nr:uncharacterized protein GLOTRDRAFT_114923 [Gloeophyllum trabeum ATCC 11539]EPQ58527.1 hypothetical protein GLOTRDRAFT_114923 [Gloeophyllum trabeum ATCC 11539]